MSDELGEKSVDTEAVEKSGIIPPSPPSSEKNTTNIIEQGEYIGLQQDEEGELEQTQQQKEALVRNGDSSSFKMGYEPLQIDSQSNIITQLTSNIAFSNFDNFKPSLLKLKNMSDHPFLQNSPLPKWSSFAPECIRDDITLALSKAEDYSCQKN